MERDHLNKVSIPFQQFDRHEICWKFYQVVSEEFLKNIMILYMSAQQGQGRKPLQNKILIIAIKHGFSCINIR